LNLVESLPVQQTLHLILVSESLDAVEFVLEDPFLQIACHADIKSSRQAAHDVRAIVLRSCGMGESRGPSTPVDIHFVNVHPRSG
jgi:hypothetical protein